MVRQTGKPKFSPEGILLKGTLVRHLVLPGAWRDGEAVMQWLAQAFPQGKAGSHRHISAVSSISHLFRTFCRMLNVFVMVHKLWVHFLAVQCIAERGRICYNLWY